MYHEHQMVNLRHLPYERNTRITTSWKVVRVFLIKRQHSRYPFCHRELAKEIRDLSNLMSLVTFYQIRRELEVRPGIEREPDQGLGEAGRL